MFDIITRHITFLSIILMSVLFSFAADVGAVEPLLQFTVTINSEAHGTVSPNNSVIVNSGDDISYMAAPQAHYMVNQWTVDGQVMQLGGVMFALKNVTANHAVTVSFMPTNLLYAGGANSYLYYSRDNGDSWRVTPTKPNDGNAIGGVFATNTAVYIATTSKYLFYSMDNGVSWQSTSTTPDYSGIECVFVTPSNTIYIGTKSGRIYHSTNAGAQWIATPNLPSLGHTVKSIHIEGSAIYAGSSDGFVYYSPNGVSWLAINGPLDGSTIQDIFVSNNTLYVNTANEYVYTSPDLTGGGSWTLLAHTVFSLFVNGDASIQYAATQSGYVFSLTTGNDLGFVSYTPINSIYYLG